MRPFNNKMFEIGTGIFIISNMPILNSIDFSGCSVVKATISRSTKTTTGPYSFWSILKWEPMPTVLREVYLWTVTSFSPRISSFYPYSSSVKIEYGAVGDQYTPCDQHRNTLLIRRPDVVSTGVEDQGSPHSTAAAPRCR